MTSTWPPSGRIRSIAVILLLSSLLAGAADAVPVVPVPVPESGLPLLGSLHGSPDGDPTVLTLDLRPEDLPRSGGAARPSVAAGGFVVDFVMTGEAPEGDTPSSVTFTPDGSTIVVAHRDTKNLVLFDASTRAFLREIPLSGSPVDVAVTADGTHAVTANVFEDSASIVDLSAGVETAVVPVGAQPGVVAITPDGATAVVGNTVDGSLSVLDIAAGTERSRIPGTGFLGSVSLAFESGAITASFSRFELANDSLAIHPDFYAGEIDFVDLATGTVTSVPSSASPRAIAITPDGTKAVVSHTGSVRLVSVLDVASRTIARTIPVGVDLTGPVAIEPSGAKAVVAVLNASRVVDLAAGTVSSNLPTASVNQLLTTADGQYALAVGFRGSLIDYATETVVKELNNVVSTAIGAVSGAGPQGVLVANLFGEDMLLVDTNGAAGFLESTGASGPPPEGDKARTVALSPDGTTAVVANILSDNVSIVDLDTRAVTAVVDVGDRPAEVAVTPDGTTAVVCNLDSSFLSIVNLGTATSTGVTISRRASQVEISPDGQYAYVAVVANGDGVWRVDLGTQAVSGVKLPTGNMGGILYAFSQTSGLTLSHDGATLVTCNSFTDNITIIDTATWSVVATVGVGNFPVRAIFSADDATIYVTNRDDDTITVVANAGGASAVTGSIPVGHWPFEMVLSPDGGTLYVANFQDRNVGTVDVASATMTGTIGLPDPPAGICRNAAGTALYAATGTASVSIGPGPLFSISVSGELSRIDTATGSVDQQVATGLAPAMLVFDETRSLAVAPSPYGDGLTLVQDATGTGVGIPPRAANVRLLPARPNPLGERTTLGYSLPGMAHVVLAIHDVAGREVVTLVSGVRPAGDHAVVWDGRSATGERVASGVYFATLVTGGRRESERLLVLR